MVIAFLFVPLHPFGKNTYQIMKEKNIDEKNLPAKTVIHAISSAKEEGQLPDDYIASIKAGNLRAQHIGSIYAEYQKRLGAYCKLELTELSEERLPQNPSRAQGPRPG